MAAAVAHKFISIAAVTEQTLLLFVIAFCCLLITVTWKGGKRGVSARAAAAAEPLARPRADKQRKKRGAKEKGLRKVQGQRRVPKATRPVATSDAEQVSDIERQAHELGDEDAEGSEAELSGACCPAVAPDAEPAPGVTAAHLEVGAGLLPPPPQRCPVAAPAPAAEGAAAAEVEVEVEAEDGDSEVEAVATLPEEVACAAAPEAAPLMLESCGVEAAAVQDDAEDVCCTCDGEVPVRACQHCGVYPAALLLAHLAAHRRAVCGPPGLELADAAVAATFHAGTGLIALPLRG